MIKKFRHKLVEEECVSGKRIGEPFEYYSCTRLVVGAVYMALPDIYGRYRVLE